MMTGNVLGDRFDSQHLQEIFICNCPAKLWAVPFPVQWILEVKRPGCEAEHSPPSDAEVKNSWSYTSSPTYICIVHGQFCLIRGQVHVKYKLVLMRFAAKNKITNHFLPKIVPYSVMVVSVQLYRHEMSSMMVYVHSVFKLTPDVTVVWGAIMLHIQEVPGSDLELRD